MQTLLGEARDRGLRSVVLTFDPHPRQILAPGQRVDFVLTQQEKIEAFSRVGVDVLIIHPFSLQFASLCAKDFLQLIMCNKLNMKCLVKGFNNHFGSDRLSDMDVIRMHGSNMGFDVCEVAAERDGSAMASSSLVRQLVREGRMAEASKILGYVFYITGSVVHGRHIGRQIGFPTANISISRDSGKILPQPGVYVASVDIDGHSLPAMMNIGSNPTVNADDSRQFVEVHVLDYSGNLYNSSLRVYIHKKIREEQKFPSLNALKTQLQQDLEAVRDYFPITTSSNSSM